MSQDILKKVETVVRTIQQQSQRSKVIRDISAELREETQLLRFEVDECLNRLEMAVKAAARRSRQRKFMDEYFARNNARGGR